MSLQTNFLTAMLVWSVLAMVMAFPVLLVLVYRNSMPANSWKRSAIDSKFRLKLEIHKITKKLEIGQLTPLKSANPLIPNVSASANSDEICSSKTFTSPEYMNVSNATTAPNDVPGKTITG